MKIILIEPEEKVRNLFSAQLSGTLGAEVLEREDAASAIGILDLLGGGVDVVITHEKIKTEKTAEKIDLWNKDHGEELLMFVLSDDFTGKSKNIHNLSINISAKALVASISEIQKSKKKQEKKPEKKETKKFTPFSISLFQFFHKMPSDIYIPIQKDGKKKMVRRYNAEDTFELSEIKSYKDKGLSHFYVTHDKKDSTLEFINQRLSEIVSSPHGKEKTKEQIQNYVLNQLSEVRFNPTVLKLAQESANEMLQRFESGNSFGDELKNILKSNLGFKYRKAYTMILLSQGMLKKFSWTDKRHYEYFALAAFLQDSELSDDDDLTILLESELNANVLDTKRHSLILNHAKISSEKLEKLEDIPSEVTKLVKQHHGSFSGVGFSNSLTSQITPLSKVLIACDEFSTRLIAGIREDINISQIIRDISKKYSDKSLDEYLEKLSENFS